MATSSMISGATHEKQSGLIDDVTVSPTNSAEMHHAFNRVTIEEVKDIKWWSEEEERIVKRKLDMAIVPLLAFIYAMAYIDRSNVGNAKTAGMIADLGISDQQYRIVTTIFYIAYICFQPLLLFYLVVPAHLWVASMTFIWGISSALQSTATKYSSLLAARFFVGLAEAGFGTGVALYLTFFFPRREVGMRFACFVSASALVSAMGGALAYGLVQVNSAIAGWRLLFIVEGVPSILLSVAIFFLLPDSPETCKFLNQRQKQIAKDRLFLPVVKEPSSSNVKGKASQIRGHITSKFDKQSIKAGLLSPVGWLTALLLWTCNVGYGAVPIFLPSILNGSGLSSLDSQGYTAPPYLVAWIFCLTEVYLSSKLQHRAGFLIFNFIVGIIGYLILALKESFAARYTAIFLVTIGLFPAVPLTYIWLITNVTSARARGMGLAILGTISQTGPVLGTLELFPSSQKPYYKKGMWISLGVLVGGLCIILLSTTYFLIQNHQRSQAAYRREYHSTAADGSGSAQDEKMSAVGERGSRLENKVVLDSNVEEERIEELRRRIDVGRNGEDSIWFRYIV